MQGKISRGVLLATTGVFYLSALVGPLASVSQLFFLVALGLLSVFLNTPKAVDQILTASVAILGVLPIFGWIDLPTWINPLQLIIATWFYVIAVNFRMQLEKTQLILSVIPLTVAPFFSYQWWKGMSEGDPVSVLSRILPIWDLSGHFFVFYRNLVGEIYIPRQAPPAENLTWAFRDYPTGIHYVWAQFANNDKSRIIENSELAIPIFTNSVVLTLVLSTLIGGLCAWRLVGATYLRIAVSMICSGVGVGLITLGPLSQTISTGFANIPPVVISMCIFLSFALKPHRNDKIQLFILGASSLCMAYNWYPTLLLTAPLMLFLLITEIRQSRKRNAVVFLAVVGPLAALPLLQTVALGLDHLEEQGGVQPFPNGLLLLLLFSVAATGLWIATVYKNTLFLAVALPPPALSLALALWLRIRTDGYPYYFHKATLFIAAYSMFALLFALITVYERQKNETPVVHLHQKVQIAFAASLLGFGLSQMFGYWGIDYPAFSGQSSAYGVLNRNEYLRPNNLLRPTASLIVTEAKRIKLKADDQRSCSTLMIPAEIGVTDRNTVFSWKGPVENIWFHSLSNSLTTEAQQLSFMTLAISTVANNEKMFLEGIKNSFHPASTCVISTPQLIRELKQTSNEWKSLEVFTE